MTSRERRTFDHDLVQTAPLPDPDPLSLTHDKLHFQRNTTGRQTRSFETLAADVSSIAKTAVGCIGRVTSMRNILLIVRAVACVGGFQTDPVAIDCACAAGN
jgi:hypothetical protein